MYCADSQQGGRPQVTLVLSSSILSSLLDKRSALVPVFLYTLLTELYLLFKDAAA